MERATAQELSRNATTQKEKAQKEKARRCRAHHDDDVLVSYFAIFAI
jgi:hypothetical protein